MDIEPYLPSECTNDCLVFSVCSLYSFVYFNRHDDDLLIYYIPNIYYTRFIVIISFYYEKNEKK